MQRRDPAPQRFNVRDSSQENDAKLLPALPAAIACNVTRITGRIMRRYRAIRFWRCAGSVLAKRRWPGDPHGRAPEFFRQVERV
jgi:hypothetical protein